MTSLEGETFMAREGRTTSLPAGAVLLPAALARRRSVALTLAVPAPQQNQGGQPGAGQDVSGREGLRARHGRRVGGGEGSVHVTDSALTPPARPTTTAGLSLMEKDILKDWKSKFDAKYPKVGTVQK
jgi:hypothetical protein